MSWMRAACGAESRPPGPSGVTKPRFSWRFPAWASFKMMVEVGSLPCLDVLSTAAAVIAEGEVMQLAAAKNLKTSEDEYLAVIRAKTAALFAAACEVGPIIAGADREGDLRQPRLRHEPRHRLPADG